MLMKIMKPIVMNDANISAEPLPRLIPGASSIGPHFAWGKVDASLLTFD
jgi:hypothetical protein